MGGVHIHVEFSYFNMHIALVQSKFHVLVGEVYSQNVLCVIISHKVQIVKTTFLGRQKWYQWKISTMSGSRVQKIVTDFGGLKILLAKHSLLIKTMIKWFVYSYKHSQNIR